MEFTDTSTELMFFCCPLLHPVEQGLWFTDWKLASSNFSGNIWVSVEHFFFFLLGAVYVKETLIHMVAKSERFEKKKEDFSAN